jgi:hypothetical protein
MSARPAPVLATVTALAMTVGAAPAQTPAQDSGRFAALWAHLEARCTLAIEDPAGFLATLDPALNGGLPALTVTPDGAHAVAWQSHGEIREEIWLTDVGLERRVECMVHLDRFDGSGDPAVESPRWNAAFRAFLGTRPDLTVAGGAIRYLDPDLPAGSPGGAFEFYQYHLIGDRIPQAHTLGVSIDVTPSAYAAARLSRDAAPALAVLLAGAQTAPIPAPAPVPTPTPAQAPAPAPSSAAESNFGLAVDLCLQHLAGRDPADAFRAAGFTVTPMDEGTFDIDAPGVSGFLAPLLPTEWCWVESETLNFATVARIAYERALFRYPQTVTGPAARGTLANGCPSLGLSAGGRIHLLEIRNAGFFEGCDSPATGGVLFQ